MKRRITFAIGILAIQLMGCGAGKTEEPSEQQAENVAVSAVLPKVTDERTDLVLSWYVDGVAQTGSSVREVPGNAKKEVRIQDPTIPPEQRNPEVVYIADLTKKTATGYEVTAVNRADFEAKRQAERDAARAEAEALAKAQQPEGTGSVIPPLTLPDGAKPSVVMYATKHCPVCVKARRWLLKQRIPYIEKDLETDAAAAAEVQKKGQAQGVSTNGVPIFEINGRLLPGFDPAQIVALLAAASGNQKTI